MYKIPKTKTWQTFIGRFYLALAFSSSGWFEKLDKKCPITDENLCVYYWFRISEYMYPDDEATKLLAVTLFWFEFKIGWSIPRINVDNNNEIGNNDRVLT